MAKHALILTFRRSRSNDSICCLTQEFETKELADNALIRLEKSYRETYTYVHGTVVSIEQEPPDAPLFPS